MAEHEPPADLLDKDGGVTSSTERLHHVVQGDIDVEAAVANGTQVTARCGHEWVPIAAGSDADEYPPCGPCYRIKALQLEDDYERLMGLLTAITSGKKVEWRVLDEDGPP